MDVFSDSHLVLRQTKGHRNRVVPLLEEASAALAEYVRDLDASERQDALLTFEQLMGRPDFNRLTELLPEEAR